VELLFQQKGGSASFGAKVALSLNGVDRSCINSITGSTCKGKCSNILHDITEQMSLLNLFYFFCQALADKEKILKDGLKTKICHWIK
jgi:hypothetical protein